MEEKKIVDESRFLEAPFVPELKNKSSYVVLSEKQVIAVFLKNKLRIPKEIWQNQNMK